MRLIVTYIAAVLLAVLVYGGVKALMPRGDEPVVSATPQMTDAEAAKGLSGFPLVQTYQAMLRFFPEHVASVRAEFPALEPASKTPEAVRDAYGNRFAASIYGKYTDDIRLAPDAMLKKLMGKFVDMFEPLRNDPRACSGLLLGRRGMGGQPTASQLSQLDDFTAIAIEAMHQGNTTPQNRGAVTAEIYNGLEQILTAEDKQILDAEDVDDPRSCAAFLTYLRTAQTAQFDGADAVRAEIARNILGSKLSLGWLRQSLRPKTGEAVPGPLPSSAASTPQTPQAKAQTKANTEARRLPYGFPLERTYQAMIRYFPQDVAYVLGMLPAHKQASNTPETERYMYGARFMAHIYEKRLGNISHAPDAILKKLMGQYLDIVLLQNYDPQICAEFLIGHNMTPGQIVSSLSRLDDFGATSIEAMYQAQTSPQIRGPKTDEIDNRLAEILKPEDKRVFDVLDLDDPRTCAVHITYWQTAQTASFDGADVLRAEMMRVLLNNLSLHRWRWSSIPSLTATAPQKPDANGFPLELTYRALSRYFPVQAISMLTNLQRVEQADDPQAAVRAEGAKILTSLHKRYGADVYYAPDAVLKKLIASRLAFLQALRNDGSTCNRFVLEGEQALTEQQQKLLSDQSDALSATLVEAMHYGEATPQQRPPVSQDAYDRLFARLSGTLERHAVRAMREPNAENPRDCAMYRLYLGAALSADFSGADRLRAQMAVDMREGKQFHRLGWSAPKRPWLDSRTGTKTDGKLETGR
jgi:hypothetical protein